ncbi:MAG: type IV pilin N-terminal domain-containing protein [Candidatus Thermoplasmatota archaeon]|nr:type IV pilin N-terminal domain-containing protein [Candidatus Thermoplasmatota archaeon]MBU1941634.1 type IV pilin N-terminal domain-containing protein [Candidatus Thermoplasmatota archaeon]
MKKQHGDSGVSEIIGTILMLGMAIALFSTVSLIIISYPLSVPSPQVDIISYVDGSSIVFEHHGGPSLLLETELGITINGSYIQIQILDYLEDDLNHNNRWDIGERVVYSTASLQGKRVDVMVIDYESSSIVMMGTIQDGESQGSGSSSPDHSTAVLGISPYQQLGPSVILDATGDAELDNVSLFYRWSTDNWTNSWTTLTYDDFESGFGNYTDGGLDCLLYTGGTYAHQGNNAADIQDNRGDASSFYHTLGIDVDSPGYTSIKIDFWFYAVSMSSGHDFWVRYYDGSNWITVEDYDEGDEFVNGQFYHEIVWINETEYIFPSNMKIKVTCDANNNNNDIYVDQIYVNATGGQIIDWTSWSDASNPDVSNPWSWIFNFLNGAGYYEFYSIGKYNGDSETAPVNADAKCLYSP